MEAMPKVPRLEHRKGWAIPVEVEEQQLEASPEVLVLRRRQTDRLRERVLGAAGEEPGAVRTCPCPFAEVVLEEEVVGHTCLP